MESRRAQLYNPPAKPPRPFEADYPAGAPADAAGMLTADIEGRPLIAKHVVGRRVRGGADEPLPQAQFDAVTEAAIGKPAQNVAPGALPRRAVGSYRLQPTPQGIDRNVLVANNLPPATAARVIAYEMGHMVDELSGTISAEGIDEALVIGRSARAHYARLNSSDRPSFIARQLPPQPANRMATTTWCAPPAHRQGR
jgi:hypothetical protein